MSMIDWSQFEGIVDFDDPECMEIYQDFAEEVPSELGALKEKAEAGDHAAVAGACHKLRGSCLTFGMVAVSDILTSLEKRAKEGGDIDPANWLEDVESSFTSSHKAIEERKADAAKT